jgi:hypothetical protein
MKSAVNVSQLLSRAKKANLRNPARSSNLCSLLKDSKIRVGIAYEQQIQKLKAMQTH